MKPNNFGSSPGQVNQNPIIPAFGPKNFARVFRNNHK